LFLVHHERTNMTMDFRIYVELNATGKIGASQLAETLFKALTEQVSE